MNLNIFYLLTNAIRINIYVDCSEISSNDSITYKVGPVRISFWPIGIHAESQSNMRVVEINHFATVMEVLSSLHVL